MSAVQELAESAFAFWVHGEKESEAQPFSMGTTRIPINAPVCRAENRPGVPSLPNGGGILRAERDPAALP